MEGKSGKVLRNLDFLRFGSFKNKRSVTNMPSSKEDSDPKCLPSDLAYEILLRSPCLATLDSCKLISKDWNELINSPEFMPNYCKNTKNVCGFILQGNFSRKRQEFVSLEDTQIDDLGRSMTRLPGGRIFSMNDYDIRILASSKQGILLAAGIHEHSLKERMLYLGKPSIGYWVPLPLPNFGKYQTVSSAVVVLGTNPFRYKITRLSRRIIDDRAENSRRYHCEVFDSKTWEWETKPNGVGLGHKVYLDSSAGQPVTIGNLVHWLTTDDQVLSCNCKDDTYCRFPLPEMGLSEHKWRTLVEYEGRLGLMYTKKEEEITQVWVRTNGKWRMAREFKLEESLSRDEARPLGLYNRDIAVLAAPEKVVFYNLQSSSILRTLKTNTHGVEQNIFPFRSDLEEVDLLRSGDGYY